MATKLILDVDTGVDDAIGLIAALRCPQVEVVGITSIFGVASMEKTTRNTLLTLAVLGEDDRFKVGRGADRAMKADPIHAPETHGTDGLGNATGKYPEPRPQHGSPQADNTLIELLKAHRGECTIVCCGPLTNVARALKRHPEVAKTIRRLVIRGGALRVPGNCSTVAEFNFASDPLAAHHVMKSGLPITLVPLDVTQRVTWTRPEIEEARARDASPVNKFIADITDLPCAYHLAMYSHHGIPAHDALAVAVAVDPGLVRTFPVHVDVESAGEFTAGMTVAEFRKKRVRGAPNCDAAMEVDVEKAQAFLRPLIWGSKA